MEKYREFGNIISDTIKATTMMIAEMDEELAEEEYAALMEKTVQEIFCAAMFRIKAEIDKNPPRGKTKPRMTRKRT